MHLEQLQAFKTWFDRHVKSFYSDDPGIQAGIILKEGHTQRVCDNILHIGESLRLEKGDLHLAEAIALFHDVGRFRQYAEYATFNDRRSANHALMGVRELEQSGVLSGLPVEEQAVIMRAIECHNLCELPPDLSERQLLFTRLIRDADKLDILKIFTEYYLKRSLETNPALESGLPDTPGYSTLLVDNLLQGKGCHYKDMKNFNDRKLLMLSWVYDLNFPFTLSQIVKNRLPKKIIDSLPDTEDIQKVLGLLQEYIERRQTPYQELGE